MLLDVSMHTPCSPRKNVWIASAEPSSRSYISPTIMAGPMVCRALAGVDHVARPDCEHVFRA
jgi:hypothetical protein